MKESEKEAVRANVGISCTTNALHSGADLICLVFYRIQNIQ